MRKSALYCGMMLVLLWLAPLTGGRAQSRAPMDVAKFGLFQLNHPAFGGKVSLGHLSPHLNFALDGDLVFARDLLLFVDVTLRYMFPAQRHARPYLGAGAGIRLGDGGSVPAHLAGGVQLYFDTLPILLEAKWHLENPEAFSFWFGVQL